MNPLVLYFLTLVIVFGGFYWLIHREARRAGGLKPWLVDLPTTNFRIFISLILAIVFVVSVLLLTIIHAMRDDVRPLPDVVLDTIGMFIFGMMGLDVVSYLGKRLTHKKYADDGDEPPPGSTQQQPIPVGAQQVTVATQGGASQTTVTTQQNPPPMETQ